MLHRGRKGKVSVKLFYKNVDTIGIKSTGLRLKGSALTLFIMSDHQKTVFLLAIQPLNLPSSYTQTMIF